MNTFAEMVRAHCDGMSLEGLREVTGWKWTRCRQIQRGLLRAEQISFADAVHLSNSVGLPVENMATALQHEGR